MSTAWAKGSSRRWRATRALVLANNRATNGGRCTLALPTLCTGTATQVHHVKGKRHGDNPRWLKAVCQPCNGHIGDPDTHDPQCKICRAPKAQPQIRVMTQW